MPKVDKTGMILIGGAVGLGLILLPGFFTGRGKDEENGGPVPMDLEAFVPVPTVEDIPDDKKKPVLVVVGQPNLRVEGNRASYAYGSLDSGQGVRGSRNRGVGNHRSAGTIDVWGATNVDVISEWKIKNPSPETLPLDFLVRLRMTRDFSTRSLIFGRGWGETFGRDETSFEYTPEDGIKTDKFFDSFRESVQTTHGATQGSNPIPLSIAPGETKILRMGMHLPGPSRSKELREFWEANPEFNFKIEAYQGKKRFAEHEFKGAFDASIVRPELIAKRSTGKGDSPTLTVRSL